MALSIIEEILPKTAAYIDSVFESDGTQRGGHHNYIVERSINSDHPRDMKPKELLNYDLRQLNYLKFIDQDLKKAKYHDFQ